MGIKIRESDLKKIMRQIGISSQETIEAEEVVIIGKQKKIHIKEPNVFKIVMQGQTLYQIIGGVEIEENTMIVNVNQDDVNFIASQAGVSEEIAKKVLMEEKGDVAKALIRLKGKSV
ncbi:hypothetical protein B9Q11_03700 [Candidatus Marsarchaeota G2 archaeon ECH_B_SAG-F08]|uniref:Nascent polypeptide-associated complex protein n=5 Tax=Candidatus Marsarchaeota TaxID=1978152 RepID=A0A2R6AGY4_9ARCH|nr:MAG: hypothetical protein B9Q01_00870 [Candidatus Marsarchaeota G1 archaeon OSP_D]PSN85644.1 MAG: hypothetical protein B9Q02_05555 [Candidatus Marsarchaeota G1 archaeon BE_D]PSN89150.1 MAG: hypothetical protein B9Q00_02735 [Candidatus Marsarchaeota G1 archaeon OSP_C]PSN97657.1 MAG: hypothetical protein B9Q11_03700 [Candidatus Marsarchaeota G2 archaeon ECH_B_SAG-F08]PSO04805.1 MAG: hypothetical protein B9Q13_03460 [Candidatus Marsarchaeota G2 archaeon ECH_B_SAG-G16]